MNFTIFFSALLAFSQLTLAKKSFSPIFFLSRNTNECQTPGLHCRDCETMQHCSSNQESLFAIKCRDQSKSRPYCDMKTNTCVEELPADCPVEDLTFVCPDVGMYPDLENCNNYYICDEDKVPVNFQCSVGYIYNHTERSCSPGSYCRSYSSKTGQCKSKLNKLVAYAPSKDLYILCLTGRHSMLFQCPKIGDTFNEEEVTCKFQCTEAGYFPYHEDSSKFYSCIKDGKKFEQTLLDCPAGTEFVVIGTNQGICSIKPTTESDPITNEVPIENNEEPSKDEEDKEVEGSGEDHEATNEITNQDESVNEITENEINILLEDAQIVHEILEDQSEGEEDSENQSSNQTF